MVFTRSVISFIFVDLQDFQTPYIGVPCYTCVLNRLSLLFCSIVVRCNLCIVGEAWKIGTTIGVCFNYSSAFRKTQPLILGSSKLFLMARLFTFAFYRIFTKIP